MSDRYCPTPMLILGPDAYQKLYEAAAKVAAAKGEAGKGHLAVLLDGHGGRFIVVEETP